MHTSRSRQAPQDSIPEGSQRYQFVEAKQLVGAVYGFLVPGDRNGAITEIGRFLSNWHGELVELGGHRIPTATIDPTSIIVRHETESRETGPDGGRPRYSIDGTFIDGRKEA